MVIRETIRDALSITIVFLSATPFTVQRVAVEIQTNSQYWYMRHNKVNRLFNVFDKRYGTGFAGNVWDSNGVAPTLTTMGGVIENR